MGAFFLVLLLTLGAVGMYLAMPGGRLNAGRVGLVALIGAAAALMAAVLPKMVGDAAGWFIALGIVALWGAVRVVTHSRPVYNALYFVMVVVAVTGLLVVMEAEFLAAALLIIYAGAILVTYVFVIMLAQQGGGPATYDSRAREPFIGCVTGFLLLAILAARLFAVEAAPAIENATTSHERLLYVGTHVLTHYAVGVQITGLLLLASMVGAIAIARRKAAPEEVENT